MTQLKGLPPTGDGNPEKNSDFFLDLLVVLICMVLDAEFNADFIFVGFRKIQKGFDSEK